MRDVKHLFIDRAKFANRVQRAKARAAARLGGYILRRLRWKLSKRRISKKTKRGRPSRPGEPPTKITGKLQSQTAFVVDRHDFSVIVGPLLLSKRSRRESTGDGQTVPQKLEFGGMINVWVGPDGERSLLGSRFMKNPQKVRVEKRRLAPRPYAGPTLEESRDQIPEAFVGTFGD